MLMIKNLVLRLSLMASITLFAYNKIQAKETPISLQEAIQMALKDNVPIQIAANTKKQAILSNRIDTFRIWAPRATFMVSSENIWQSGIKGSSQEGNAEGPTLQLYIHSMPFFTLKWEFSSLCDKIFQTKIHCQNNCIHQLVAKKSVEKELQQVITAYYELALAQKKWELSNNLLKLATARLKVEEEKLKIGRISKIDCLDAQLALKQVKLSLLERQEALKGKRRNLNLILGKPIHTETLVQSTISVQPIWDMKAVTKDKVVDLDESIHKKRVDIAKTEVSRAKAYPLSCISLSGGFRSNGYRYDLGEGALHLYDKSMQWRGSIGMSIDILTFLLMPAKVQKARIALDNATFALQQQQSAVEGRLEDKTWQYRHALDAHKVAEEQLKINKQKLAFIREKYRLKQVKLLELHEAEEATQKAEIGVVEHAFKVKQAEFELYRLAGMFHEKLL